MIDWATLGEVIDALLWICGCLIVLGALLSGWCAAKDGDDC